MPADDVTDPPDLVAETIVLHLKALPDPLARRGHAERHPDYRLQLALKRLLRDYGFRVTRIETAKGEGSGDEAQ